MFAGNLKFIYVLSVSTYNSLKTPPALYFSTKFVKKSTDFSNVLKKRDTEKYVCPLHIETVSAIPCDLQESDFSAIFYCSFN